MARGFILLCRHRVDTAIDRCTQLVQIIGERDRGILAYVSNGGYIDSNSADGLRKTFIEDFDHLYIYNLRGNARTSGVLRQKERGNVFEQGSRATVAIMIGVKDPTHTGDCVLHYRDIGDYLTREDKLGIIRESTITSNAWETITPNSKGEWINQSSDIFDTLPPLGDKKSETGQTPILTEYSRGIESARDAWVYNFSHEAVERNVTAMTETYDEVRRTYHADPRPKRNEKDVAAWLATHPEFSDSTRISWPSTVRNHVARDTKIEASPKWITKSVYRPFAKQNVYFHSHLNHRPGQLPSMFPTPNHPNHGFYLVGMGSAVPFSLIAIDSIPDLHVTGAGSGGQFFPRCTWVPVDSPEPDLLSGLSESSDGVVVDGYRRVDNITDATLSRYQEAFGQDVTKDAIFAHIYALLHSEQYRTTFAAELKRQLPRIPLPSSVDFWAFASAGQKLVDLHINYEDAEPYPLNEQTASGGVFAPDYYRVQKMKWDGKARSADKSRLIYNTNITLTGIPDEAHQYILGSRSALEWLIDRYQVKTDKNSGITNDPNDWAEEQGEPRYILDLVKKITTVSVKTVHLTRSLPNLGLEPS